MTDLISRQAAIDAMANTLWHYPNECYRNLSEYEFAKGLAELGLKSVPPAQPEQRWIPCSERLPDDYTDVLVWFEYFRHGDYNCLYQTYGIGDYSTKYDSWMINHETGWHKLRVIAWMPIPEPYKEGQDGER